MVNETGLFFIIAQFLTPPSLTFHVHTAGDPANILHYVLIDVLKECGDHVRCLWSLDQCCSAGVTNLKSESKPRSDKSLNTSLVLSIESTLFSSTAWFILHFLS